MNMSKGLGGGRLQTLLGNMVWQEDYHQPCTRE